MTTSLALVVFTTVVFGSTVGVLQKFLSTSQNPESLDVTFAAEDNYQQVVAKTSDKKDSARGKSNDNDDFQKALGSDEESFDLSADEESAYEDMVHPNEEKSE